jgi:multidrug transporter EmrE-like cation transporter
MLYFYVLCILLSETTALSFLKKFAQSSQYQYLALGLLFYVLVSLFLVKSFQYENMGIVNVLWSAFSVILVLSVGVLYFKEAISYAEIGAMVLILSGVVILKFQAA